MSKYLTIAEIAEQADIPNSTCRRYLASFEAFFLVKGGSRLKKYEVGAVDILKRIKDLYESGMDTNEIHSILANEFPLVVNGDEQQETSEDSPAVPSLATTEDVAEIKKALEEQKAFNAQLLQEMKNQYLYYEKKFEELQHDRGLINSLRNSMEQRKIDSDEQGNKSNEQLKNIERQLSELRQNQHDNEVVKRLSGQIAELNRQLEQMQKMVKETASTQEQKKVGFWSRFLNK